MKRILFEIIGQLFGIVKRYPKSSSAILLDAIITLFNLVHNLQQLFMEYADIYVPHKSILSFIIFFTLTICFFEKLGQKKTSILTGEHILLIPKKTRKRRMIRYAFFVFLFLSITLPPWLTYRYYHPGPSENKYLIYIDPFKVEGWEQNDLIFFVRRELNREISKLMPGIRIEILETPKGIVDQSQRFDWACEKGAMIIIYATGSPNRLFPHIKICTCSSMELPIFYEDTVDTSVDFLLASSRVQMNQYYSSLPYMQALHLCMIEQLTPERIDYMAMLAVGLFYLYNGENKMDINMRFERAHDFFARAAELGQELKGCNLNYCEALDLLGNTKLGMALIATQKGEFDVARRIWNEADSIFNFVIALKPDLPEAMNAKAFALIQLGKIDDAISIYNDIFNRFGLYKDSETRSQVANALLMKGVVLWMANRHNETIEIFDNIVNQFEKDSTHEVRNWVATAIYNKGACLGEQAKYADAIQSYDDVINYYRKDKEMPLQWIVASALFNKGVSLGRLGYIDSAYKAFDEVITYVGDSKEENCRILSAWAQSNKAVCAWAQNNNELAIKIIDDLVSHFEIDINKELHHLLTRALYIKGLILSKQGHREKAMFVFDDIINRSKGDDKAIVDEQLLEALYGKSSILAQLNRYQEAISIYDRIIKCCDSPNGSSVLNIVLKASSDRAEVLCQLERYNEALIAYNEFVSRFGSDTTMGNRIRIAKAFYNRGVILNELDYWEDALKSYDEAVGRYREDNTPGIKEIVARAYYNKGTTLWLMGRYKNSDTAFCSFWNLRNYLNGAEFNDMQDRLRQRGILFDSCKYTSN